MHHMSRLNLANKEIDHVNANIEGAHEIETSITFSNPRSAITTIILEKSNQIWIGVVNFSVYNI